MVLKRPAGRFGEDDDCDAGVTKPTCQPEIFPSTDDELKKLPPGGSDAITPLSVTSISPVARAAAALPPTNLLFQESAEFQIFESEDDTNNYDYNYDKKPAALPAVNPHHANTAAVGLKAPPPSAPAAAARTAMQHQQSPPTPTQKSSLLPVEFSTNCDHSPISAVTYLTYEPGGGGGSFGNGVGGNENGDVAAHFGTLSAPNLIDDVGGDSAQQQQHMQLQPRHNLKTPPIYDNTIHPVPSKKVSVGEPSIPTSSNGTRRQSGFPYPLNYSSHDDEITPPSSSQKLNNKNTTAAPESPSSPLLNDSSSPTTTKKKKKKKGTGTKSSTAKKDSGDRTSNSTKKKKKKKKVTEDGDAAGSGGEGTKSPRMTSKKKSGTKKKTKSPKASPTSSPTGNTPKKSKPAVTTTTSTSEGPALSAGEYFQKQELQKERAAKRPIPGMPLGSWEDTYGDADNHPQCGDDRTLNDGESVWNFSLIHAVDDKTYRPEDDDKYNHKKYNTSNDHVVAANINETIKSGQDNGDGDEDGYVNVTKPLPAPPAPPSSQYPSGSTATSTVPTTTLPPSADPKTKEGRRVRRSTTSPLRGSTNHSKDSPPRSPIRRKSGTMDLSPKEQERRSSRTNKKETASSPQPRRNSSKNGIISKIFQKSGLKNSFNTKSKSEF